jgi:hypothetical protein
MEVGEDNGSKLGKLEGRLNGEVLGFLVGSVLGCMLGTEFGIDDGFLVGNEVGAGDNKKISPVELPTTPLYEEYIRNPTKFTEPDNISVAQLWPPSNVLHTPPS